MGKVNKNMAGNVSFDSCATDVDKWTVSRLRDYLTRREVPVGSLTKSVLQGMAKQAMEMKLQPTPTIVEEDCEILKGVQGKLQVKSALVASPTD